MGSACEAIRARDLRPCVLLTMDHMRYNNPDSVRISDDNAQIWCSANRLALVVTGDEALS